jgi:hypothetical protein
MPNTVRIQLMVNVMDDAVNGDNEQGFIKHGATSGSFCQSLPHECKSCTWRL